jgi:hypothetical protein
MRQRVKLKHKNKDKHILQLSKYDKEQIKIATKEFQ